MVLSLLYNDSIIDSPLQSISVIIWIAWILGPHLIALGREFNNSLTFNLVEKAQSSCHNLEVSSIIGKMVGGPLGWGPLKIQPQYTP